MNSQAIVDITPHPRILQVLGEIEFKPWQCIAELIDNSIDEFLRMQRVGTPVVKPLVMVAFGRDSVAVKDNGPGMSLDNLKQAVRAGWTSNERFGNLGLYGIGFNISTARLGFLTEIWTTRSGDREWYGLEIDLQKMARGESYSLDVKTRTKSDDPNLSGTEVNVRNLKQDWRDLFAKETWVRNNITTKLSRIYGAMLRPDNPQPISFILRVNDKNVSAWEHCVWAADTEVYRKNEGSVRPIQEIDISFGKRFVSRSTGEIYEMPPEELTENDIMEEVQERVYGWIGIQRYADDSDYGIDILRNGRKIEVGCKDVFCWEDVNGKVRKEYPVDDPAQRGRIVGEIHLNHGYVHYTKDRFEREHSSWKQLLIAIRNNEPLTHRSESEGFSGVNNSPLGTLYRTFRRNSPLSSHKEKPSAWRDILCIQDHGKAKLWADKYRKGEPEFRLYEKWIQELETNIPPGSASSSLNNPQLPVDNDEQSSTLLLNLTDTSDLNTGELPNSQSDRGFSAVNATQNSSVVPVPEIRRSLIPELSLKISGIGISGKVYDIEVFSIEVSSNTSPAPWRSRATARGIYEIDVYLEHPAFNSTSLQVRDAILAEAAYIITSEESASLGVVAQINYADVLVALRNRYSLIDSLDPSRLHLEIDSLRKHFIKQVAKAIPISEQQQILLAELQTEDIQKIELVQARNAASSSIVNYLEMNHVAILFERRPDIFFNVGCFNRPWTPPSLSANEVLLEEYRKPLLRDLLIPMIEIGEFSNTRNSVLELSKNYLALIRACVNRVQEFLIDNP